MQWKNNVCHEDGVAKYNFECKATFGRIDWSPELWKEFTLDNDLSGDDPSKCTKHGVFDDDCCTHPTYASCADGYWMESSNQQCYTYGNSLNKAFFFKCYKPDYAE